MPSDGTAHYLRPAGKTSTPAAVIFLDSESRQRDDSGMELHTLRLWEAQLVRRRDRRRPGEHLTATGNTPTSVAQCIDSWASYSESAWLYAHNVAFDLTVTDLATELGGLGWQLSSRFAVGADSMWCVFHKGARDVRVKEKRNGKLQERDRVKWAHTLTIADSGSLFPVPLAQLGNLLGMVKPALPSDDDSDEAWSARCHADVDILRAAVLAMMDWWDRAELGRWTVSGAGQGWQHYRSTLEPRQVVIDHDEEITALERQAVYGGRRDVFRIGQLPGGRYAEVDFEAAYPQIAASFQLPARVAGPVNDDHRRLALHGRVPGGMLAEVTLNTDSAQWPVRLGGRVFYPCGRFKTTLAAPDIQAAADAHALEQVHDGLLYTMTAHLKPWAREVLSWIRAPDDEVPPVVKVWAKLAARAVIGKFAQPGWRTEPWVGPPCQGWSIEQASDYHTGTRQVITGVNGEYWLSWADQRGDHERPAVLAFVEAHVRARLGKIIAGPYGPAVIQCDTDGVMVSHARLQEIAGKLAERWVRGRQVRPGADEAIAYWNEQADPLRMREKTQFQKAVVHGPQHVVLDGRPRFAGVPKGAWQTGDETWAARLWPGITWQSQNAPAAAYARPVQPYLVAGPYAAAWVMADGSVRPAEAAIGVDGVTSLLDWKHTRWASDGLQLAARQGIWADGLWEVPEQPGEPPPPPGVPPQLFSAP